MQFKEVIGQDETKHHIVSMIKNNRMPHALLLSGKDGVGTMPMALATAQYLQCEAPGEIDSCGVCTSCMQMIQLVNPDLHFSFPTVSVKPGSKNLSDYFIKDFKEFILQTPYADIYDWFQFINVENKQGNISAEECRNILEQMQLKSYQGKNKITIIWRPEYFGKEGNRLLKFIEEPAPNTFLIFVAEQEDKILNTILSRLQRVTLKPIGVPSITNALITNFHKNEEEALKIALMAQGDYGNAIKILRHWEDELLGLVKQWMNATYANKGLLINDWVETVAKMGRESIKSYLLYMQELFTYALRITYAPDYPIHLPDADADFVRKLSNMNLSTDIYENINNGIAKTSYNIERNANAKIQLQHLSIQMQYWIKGGALVSKF